MALENIHGFWGLLPNEDDIASPMLLITFHHSNRATHDVKMKKLFWKKGGVWMDNNHHEAFIMQGVRPSSTMVEFPQLNVLDMLMQDSSDMYAEIASIIEGRRDECDVKAALRWFHPGKMPDYVFLMEDGTVRFRATHITRSHGSWKYAATTEGDFFYTHFHCNGTTDSQGLPQAPPTLLKRYKKVLAFVPEAGVPVFFAAGVECKDSHQCFVVSDNAQMGEMRTWHIFAQVVYNV